MNHPFKIEKLTYGDGTIKYKVFRHDPYMVGYNSMYDEEHDTYSDALIEFDRKVAKHLKATVVSREIVHP